MTDDELDLVETERLVDALHRRQGPRGALAVVYVHDITADKETTKISYRGGWSAVVGGMTYELLRLIFPPTVARGGDFDNRPGV